MSEDAELLSLRRECSTLRERNARLQRHVDAEGRGMVNRIAENTTDAANAAEAIDVYDDAWFDALPYSPDVTRAIAERLLSALERYPYLDASAIERRAKGLVAP